MEGGLWYFHANPDKASGLGKRGGRAKSPTSTPGVSEHVARSLKSVEDVTKLLGDTIYDLRAGTIDSRLANTVGFLATGMLKELQRLWLEPGIFSHHRSNHRMRKSHYCPWATTVRRGICKSSLCG
jgi:hypothetical protein